MQTGSSAKSETVAAQGLSFGPFRFDRANGLLFRDGDHVALPPKALGVLDCLLEGPGRVVTKQELHDRVWDGTYVGDRSISEAVGIVREALCDDPQDPTYIETVHRRGYRFIAPLEVEEGVGEATDRSASESNLERLVSRIVKGVTRGARRELALPWVVGVTVGAIAAGLAVWSLTRPTPGPLWQLEIVPPDEASLVFYGNTLALSPDGNTLVYVAVEDEIRRLYQRPMAQLAATPVPGTEGAIRPFFSPDGQWVAFRSDDNLNKVSLAGGEPILLCGDCVSISGAGDWAPDDTIIFSANGSLWQISASGGEPELVAEPDPEKGETAYLRPEILPGGGAVLFEIRRGGAAKEGAGIAVISLDTLEVRIVSERGTDPLYAETGHVVFAQGITLFAVGFDPGSLMVTGQPIAIRQNVAYYGGGASQFSFSRDGTLAYIPATVPASLDNRLVWVDRQGATEPVMDQLHRHLGLRLSPDGSRVAVQLRGEDRRSDIWILEIEQRILQRLTAEGTENMSPIWTPDGTRVTFSSIAGGGTPDLYWKRADFSDLEAELILHSEHALYPATWSPDGRTLVFSEEVTTGDKNIMLLPFDAQRTPGTPSPFVATEHDETAAMLSPDGKWLAFVSDLSGQPEVYVAPFPAPGGRRVQISDAGGVEPLWRPDGQEIFYLSGDKMVAVAVETETAFEVVSREFLFEGGLIAQPHLGYSANTGYDIRPDGQRFLMRQGTDQPDARQQRINIAINWFEELRRLATTDR